MKGNSEENILNSLDGSAKRKGKAKFFIIPFIAIALAAAIAVIVPRIYYNSRWYSNTYISGENVSGMTLGEAKAALHSAYGNYSLTISGRDNGKLVISKNDIDYKIDIEATVQEQFDRQHSDFSIFDMNKRKDITINPIVSYNKDKLKKYIKNSELMKGSSSYKVVKPVNAKVSYSKDKNYYEIIEESQGNKIKFKKLIAAVEEALDTGAEAIDISDASKYAAIYKKPSITSESQVIKAELTAMNGAVLRWLKWKIGKGVVEKLAPNQISEWLTYKNKSVQYDTQAIRDWMEQLCLKYKTLGGTRTFKSHTGEKLQISGGDYGWCMDYEQMVTQLTETLEQKIDSSLQDAYINDASAANKKALTIAKEPIYSGTAYVQNFDNKMKDFDENNYTEISIAEQMVYVIRNGKVAYSTNCITGRPDYADRATKTGVYFVKEHRKENILRGADYATPVTNWVRISWTGTGFHSATWQDWSSWSVNTYKTRGSHGCINLSVQSSEVIYNMLKYKEAVFVH